jgi:tetratricopeptide (TPR) repeat protein
LLSEAQRVFESVRARFGMACVLLEEARALHAVNRNVLALEKAHEAVQALNKLNQPLELVRAYDTLASIQARRLQRDESMMYAKRAHALYLEFNAPNSLAWNRCLVAGLYVDLGLFVEALALYKEALSRFEAANNKNGVAWVWLQTGVVHRRRCSFDMAERLIHRAKQFYEESLSLDRVGLCWLELALIKYSTADTEDALLLNRRALKVFTRLRQTESMARALLQCGQVFHDRGQLAKGRALVSEAARLFRDIDHKIGALRCDNELAEIDIAAGALASAEAVLAQAKPVADRWGLGHLRAITELNLARLAFEQGRLQQALQYLDRAETFAQKQESRDVQAEISLARAHYWLLVNEPMRLREAIQHAEAFVNTFRLERLAARTRIRLGELLAIEGNLDAAKAVFEETARHCKIWRQRRRRAEALLGALQISRGSRSLDELLRALSYIKRDARAVDAPALQMMCQMANQLFHGAKTRTSIKKWDGSPLYLWRKQLIDFLMGWSPVLADKRQHLLAQGPADLYLLRPRDPMSALPVSVVS